MKRIVPVFLAAVALCGQCFAAEPAKPSVGAAVPASVPVLVELPDSLHERNARLQAERMQLTLDLAKAVEDANAKAKEVLPSIAILRDESQRAAIAPKAIEAIRTIVQLDMERNSSGGNRNVVQGKPGEGYSFYENAQFNAGLLKALGDQEGADTLAAFAKLNPQTVSTVARMITAGDAEQRQIVSALLDQFVADPMNQVAVESCILIVRRRLPADPALSEKVFSTVKEHAKSSTTSAKMFVSATEARVKAEATAQGVGSELAIKGTLADGTSFSTADWKGKVILVDFWATWCGPCKAELPKVTEIYNKYHAEGLEVLGVSNDYSGDDLRKFIAQNPQMPWPHLFDSAAAANRSWHPVTLGFGIRGIPTMYLIDRKGVLRSVEARKDYETLIPQLLAEPGE